MFSRNLLRLRGAASQIPKNVSQSRGYLTREQYEKEVPKEVQQALEKTPPSTQPQGDPSCHSHAERNRVAVQRELNPGVSGNRTSSSTNWTDKNAKGVMERRPATLHGENLTTPHSEFSEDHAVTVVSPTRSHQGKPLNGKTEFVVLDPDTTHHPATQKAAEEGRLEPRHSTRIMTHEQLKSVTPKEEPPLSDGSRNVLPAVTQTRGNNDGGLMSWLFGSG